MYKVFDRIYFFIGACYIIRKNILLNEQMLVGYFMNIKLFFVEHWKCILAVVLILTLIVCSVTVLAKTFTNPETYRETISSIDEKKLTVLSVSAAIAGSATLLAAVPDDGTTPLAEELMDLSSYLFVVVCVLVLEKSLLTVFGAVSCYFLLPLAGILSLVYMLKRNKTFITWAIKIFIIALVFLVIVPSAMRISDYIYDVNQVVIEGQVEEVTPSEPEDDNKPWYEKLWNAVTNAVENTVNTAIETGKKALNKFVDAVSVFVIAYCAVPIFVIFFLLWLFKFLFGLTININFDKLSPSALRERKKGKKALTSLE